MHERKMKLPIITERFLTVIIKVLGSKTEISQRALNNIKKLLLQIDRRYYEDYDINLAALLKAVDIITDFKIKNKENGEDISENLIMEIQSELSAPYYKDTIDGIIVPVLKDSKNKKYPYEAEFVNDEIHTYLLYNKIIGNREEVVTKTNNIATSSGRELREELKEFRSMLDAFSDYYREVDIMNMENSIIYSNEASFFDELKASYDKSRNPAYVLKTGLQLFNSALSDRNGLTPGYYLFYANINSFKSGLLEHFCRWIYLYNAETFRRIKKKTGKKPLILFCSLENSKQDDNERFVKMYTHRDIHTFNTFTDLESAWKKAIEDASGIQFQELNDLVEIAYYYPTHPITVEDLKKLCQQLQDQNYILVSVIVDYLEKLRARLEDLKRGSEFYLGKISEDLFELSKFLDCPLISAHQINRAGASTLFNAKDSGKQNAVTDLNSTYIGKDWDIEKPASFSGFIDLEKDPATGKTYLEFKKQKQRGKRTKVETFVHEVVDGIVIEDDIRFNKPTSLLALTAPNNENLAFHISNRLETNGSRGKTKLNNQSISLSSSNSNNSHKKASSITLKQAAAAVLDILHAFKQDYMFAEEEKALASANQFNSKNRFKKNSLEFISSKYTFTIKDRIRNKIA